VKARLVAAVAAQVEQALANASLRQKLLSLSVRDPLTGLFNRRYMEETLARVIRRARRGDLPFVVAMLVRDHFKGLNVTCGLLAGDAVLRGFGTLLPGQLRGGDVACRFGGDEFVVVLPEATLSGAVRRIRRLQARAERVELDLEDLTLRLPTLSAGVAAYPEHGANAQELLAAADAALYRAKAAGRNRVSA
jgi:diguanylate cyclase (GGDEF)-like protein